VERIVRKLPRKATRTKAKVKECLPPIDEIVKIDDAQWRIDRDLVDYYVKHLDEAEKLAWIGWHRNEEGDIDGFKIKRIRCGSVLDQAGFKNGDVVLEINGRPVTSIPQAIGAYYRLRTKRNLRVDLAREGETVRLKYKLS
jgi:S1-C subfamily serine protease